MDDAYQVIHEGIAVGSITRRKIPHQGEVWAWQIYLFGRLVADNSGQEETSNQAEAAFRAAWDRSISPADLEWIRQRAYPTKRLPNSEH